jgi:hypothetical protein
MNARMSSAAIAKSWIARNESMTMIRGERVLIASASQVGRPGPCSDRARPRSSYWMSCPIRSTSKNEGRCITTLLEAPTGSMYRSDRSPSAL